MKTKLLLALLFIGIAASAQYTLIPDINFEKKLIALNIDSGTPDGKVLTANVASVKSLDVNNTYFSPDVALYISDLTGIESFVSLTSLVCNSNHLTALNVSKNIALKNLSCYENKIATLDVSQNTALQSLDCTRNLISTLDVSKNTALTHLECSGPITTLDVSKNTALTHLWCSGPIITLDVSKNTALTILYISSTKISTLDLSKNTALTDLRCVSNQLLTTLDVSQNTALSYLDCTFNKITTLDVSQKTALKELRCYSNALTSLNVSQDTALSYLECYSNKITTLDLSTNSALAFLSCYNNSLTSLNLKNGAYYLLSFQSSFTHNPNLSCIQVDDKTYADTYWLPCKDATASFSTDCSALGVKTNTIVFKKMSIYPNPTKGELHIDNVNLENATVYDASGKTVKSAGFDNASDKNTMNLSGIAKGVYYIFIEAEGAQTTEKIIIE